MVFLTILGGGFVGIVGLLVVSSILRGYALSVLWGWFMVPTLHLPTLSVVQAIGIAMVINYLTHTDTSDLQEKEQSVGAKFAKNMLITLLYPLFALFFGWIVNQFM